MPSEQWYRDWGIPLMMGKYPGKTMAEIQAVLERGFQEQRDVETRITDDGYEAQFIGNQPNR